jgi:trigger factor
MVLKKQDTAVTDEDVDKALENLGNQRATFDDADGRPVAMDDFAVINYTGSVDGTPILDLVPDVKHLGHNPQFWLWMREDGFLPKFAEQVVGMSKGDKRTITIEFPADFPQAAVAGKTAQYEVELVDIKIKKAPPIDDAFAQELAKMDLAELKTRIRENLEQEKQNQAGRALRAEVMQKLISAVDFDLPPSAVEEETHAAVYDIVSENQSRGIAANVLEDKKDEIYSNAAKSAKELVKFKFVANRIAEQEKIEVTREQLAQHVGLMAQREGIPIEKMADKIRKNDAFGPITQQILRQRVLDFVLKEAKFE